MKQPACALALTLTLLGAATARPQQDLVDDEVGLLYSSQMHFGPDGIPQVTIGIMEDPQVVLMSSPDGLELSYVRQAEGQWVKKITRTPPGQVWRFRVASSAPGQVTYWCGVASIPYERKEQLSQSIDQWKERGESVQVFEVGSVFGIRGHVIDNRTYILGVRPCDSESDARQVAAAIFTRYGTKTFTHAHLSKRPTGRIRVLDKAGREADIAEELVRVRSLGDAPVTVHRVEFGKGYKWHGFQDRQYAGTLLLTLNHQGHLVVINRVAVDRLLQGLVPSEIFPDAPMEALKAQAVVARGEVLAKIGTRHFLDPYLLCATTDCQVYAGVGAEKPRTSLAVRATRGELLFLGPQLVDSVYSASCGGHTEDNDAVWTDPPSPALRGKPDMPADQASEWAPLRDRLEAWLGSEPPAFCRLSSFNRPEVFRWARTIPSEEMNRLVALVKPVGQVVSIQVLSRGVSGRVQVVRVVGTQGDLVVQREWPIRKLFGTLRSGMFTLAVETDEEQMPVAFRFTGGGWGHGVGMCQIGATGMAEQGYDYRQILSHYYGGARVFRLYGTRPDPPRAQEPPPRAP